MKYLLLRLLPTVVVFFGLASNARPDVFDNWTTNQIATNMFTFSLRHVVYGNGRYVAVADQSDGCRIYTSEDGLNWTFRFTDPSSWGLSLTFSSGHFCGISAWAMANVSSNGIDWLATQMTQVSQDFTPADITYAPTPGGYVVVGGTNGVGSIWSSPNGATWIPRTISGGVGGPISSVAYGFSTLIAIGNNDGAAYTCVLPSTTWNRRSIPGGKTISCANGRFFVPLNSNTNLISIGGTSPLWTPLGTGLTNMLGKVVYANGLYMAQAGNYFATSTDGTNWIQHAKQMPGNASTDVSVATDGNRLVTIGTTRIPGTDNLANGFIYTSDPLVELHMTNDPATKLVLSGLEGRTYQIQSVDNVPAVSNAWRTNLALQLTTTPYTWTDNTATNSQRFYRAVLLP
ncbi:hypothetical protein [Pedosphaera parvula]|uniref:Uncharacterized protein n=1 Tax=Pedosphaera parvula (strain Ellin514) TaxID=320771 RepID=B9XGX0_PEDPL|nr:hypothetical protein [Pedosphaera parvula]EEF60891.1 hypothetical protein Cflav_PD4060 [Pedosphaera parvula Ellin514]